MRMESCGPATAHAWSGETPLLLAIAELASIICTGPKEVFWVASAAERRKVQWKGLPVQWKATPGAAESWSSHK